MRHEAVELGPSAVIEELCAGNRMRNSAPECEYEGADYPGESGVGKELVAHAIHQRRPPRPDAHSVP